MVFCELFGTVDDVVEGGIGKRRRARHDALMASAFGLRIKIGATHCVDGDARLLGFAHDVLHEVVALEVVGKQDAFDGHTSAERFDNGAFSFNVFSHTRYYTGNVRKGRALDRMAKQRRKYLIVDGYNVLRSGSRYVHLRDNPDYTDDVLNKSREALINDVIAFMGRDYKEGVIVFDGGDNALSLGSDERIGAVRVMFTAAGSSADKVIEKLAYDARQRGWEVMVVTSDATIQDTVFGSGVDRMSANGFSREGELMDEEVRLDEHPAVAQKRTVASRIDPAVAEALKALRDSL